MPEDRPGAVEIQRAGGDDFEPVAELWTEAYVKLRDGGRTIPYSAEEARESDRDGALFVARAASGLVGAVGLYLPGDPGGAVRSPDEAEISRLAVATSARRQGIARRLLAHAHGLVAASAADAIVLWSRPSQTEAHRLYESLGYRRAREREKGDGRVIYRL